MQHPDYVVVVYERMHEYRVIPLDGREALNPDVRLYMGDSRGRWEGDTLVVEVTNFSDQTTYRRSGAARKLTERYTRVDADTVRVEFTVDDATTWTSPWTAAVEGKRDPNYWQIFEYACHEGNIRHVRHPGRRVAAPGARGGGRLAVSCRRTRTLPA